MSGGNFLCPVCKTPHRTLRTLLVCCPEMLRAMTDELEDHPGIGVRLSALLSGDCPATLLRRAYARLNPEEVEDGQAA